jgi:hypothetical protein
MSVEAVAATLSFDVGIIHLAYCLIRMPEGEIMDWEIICLAEEGEKAKKITLGKLGTRLFARLDAIWDRWGPEVIQRVLIENQPSRLNGNMKSVQMMLYSYFLYKGVPETLLVNACGKLKTHETGMAALSGVGSMNGGGAAGEGDGNGAGGAVVAGGPVGLCCPYEDSYRKNKWWSVQLTGYYVREDEELKALLQSHKKKDDLCDALLQAIGWFHKVHKTGPEITRVWKAVPVAVVAMGAPGGEP